MNFYLLGRKIRQLRNMHHLSQANLAEMIDVSTNYIGQIERGDRKPSIETLVLLCNTLNTSMDYMLSDSLISSDDLYSHYILSQLSSLSKEEKKYFYNVIASYVQLKEKIKNQ